MTVAVVGVGAQGKRYLECLREAGLAAVGIDVDGRQQHRSVAEVPYPDDVSAWVISSPAATRLATLREILDRAPTARVLVGQPVCAPSELDALRDLVVARPRARVMADDVHAHSHALRSYTALVHRLQVGDPVVRVAVEFSRHRGRDERGNHPVPDDVADEWFHLLPVARRLLSGQEYRQLLATPAALAEGYGRTDAAVLSGDSLLTLPASAGRARVELASSGSGIVHLPDLAPSAYAGRQAGDYLAARSIPRGSGFRYRVARLDFASGRSAMLVFDPGSAGSAGSAPPGRRSRDVHHLVLAGGGESRRQVIREDLLRTALLTQLSELGRPGGTGLRLLRLPEHRFLAGLAAVRRREGPVAAAG